MKGKRSEIPAIGRQEYLPNEKQMNSRLQGIRLNVWISETVK
jgi:hypothetical protein